MIRVGILSDDGLLREGLQRLLAGEEDVSVAGTAEGLPMAGALLETDVLLVDSRLPGALALVRQVEDRPAVILLQVPEDEASIQSALDAGARGILSRTVAPEQLRKAIQVVHAGEVWASRKAMDLARRRWLGGEAAADPLPDVSQLLSPRERDVMRGAADGLTNRELADKLAISEATVKAHLGSVFQKLGLRSRVELAAIFGHAPTARDR